MKWLQLSPCFSMERIEESLPNLAASYKYIQPQKCIHTASDIDRFLKTKAFARIMTFTVLLNTSVTQKKVSDACHVSEVLLEAMSLCMCCF